MARLPRIVIPDYLHHVTQCGNRREQTFFEEGDYALYRDLLGEVAQKAEAKIWCYCLIPNHVHIIIVPSDWDGLRRTFADAHRRYTGYINARMRVASNQPFMARTFWFCGDGRTASCSCRTYVSLNPIRAKLVAHAQNWKWSSIAAHLSGRNDGLVTVAPISEYGRASGIQRSSSCRSDRPPFGNKKWLEKLEKLTGRQLKPQKRGPKRDAML